MKGLLKCILFALSASLWEPDTRNQPAAFLPHVETFICIFLSPMHGELLCITLPLSVHLSLAYRYLFRLMWEVIIQISMKWQ